MDGPATDEGLRAVLELKMAQLLQPGFGYWPGWPKPRFGSAPPPLPAVVEFPSRQHPQNKFELRVDFAPGFSPTQAVRSLRLWPGAGP
jgi:hypothetical protein